MVPRRQRQRRDRMGEVELTVEGSAVNAERDGDET